MQVPSEVSIEQDGKRVTANAVLQGCVLTLKMTDGRTYSEQIRSVAPAIQLSVMLRVLASADPEDPAFRPDIA